MNNRNEKKLEFENKACKNGIIHFSLKFPSCDQFYEFTSKKREDGWRLWVIGGDGNYRKIGETVNCAWDTIREAKKYLYKKLRMTFY